ncbi:MAG: hypothetical protein AB7F89_19380 [Pirellulaceae bacterium]
MGKAWRRLRTRLEHAHTRTHAPLVARQVIRGWIQQMGPCYVWEDRDAVCERILGLLNELAFEEAAYRDGLLAWWETASAACSS